MTLSVVLPVLILAAAGWAVPWLLSKLLPEGVFWLVLIGALSIAILTLISAAGFYVLYAEAGEAVLDVAPWHFVELSAKAALVWGPIMIVSLANLPKGWKEAVW